MEIPAPIAAVDGRRQIVVIDPTGHPHPQTTGGPVLWATWGHQDPTATHYWPTWSPDRRHLAAFRIPKAGGGQGRVWVTDTSGVLGAEVGWMDQRVPVALQWSPSGDRLGIVTKEGIDFVLRSASPHDPDDDVEMHRGALISFCWLPSGRLGSFVQAADGSARITVSTPGGPARHLAGLPGNFRSPVGLGDGVAYVAHLHQQIVVVVSSPDGSRVRELEQVGGLVALAASPDHRTLARAIAPDGVGGPYRHLDLIDVATAEVTSLPQLDCHAFFWLPGSDGFVVARTEAGAVTWDRVDLDGRRCRLAHLVPSPDTRAFLRFFEQYAPAHPIVDPTGTALVLSGTAVGRGPSTSRLFLAPLDGSGAEELGEGMFATFPLPRGAPDGS